MVVVCKVLETVLTSCCQVVNLARFKLARVSAIPSDIGNTCTLQSFSSN
jgi:hypothetical protein